MKKGRKEFQLQTEYAGFPQPRVTTTIFAQGRVLHKVEKSIEKSIESIEEMHRIEDLIKTQHSEISRALREEGVPTGPGDAVADDRGQSRLDRIRRLEEVERVFMVSPDGKPVNDRAGIREFKRLFKHIIKELPNLITVFASLPGGDGGRETGIYEIEAGRVLLLSAGVEFYLALIRPHTDYSIIKGKLNQILSE